MATWPATLPAPLRDGVSVELGNNSVARKCQSGRTEAVRYGSGSPDRWQVKIRLLGAQFDVFRSFFNADLNIGTNWFSAEWITKDLGYSDHKGKVVGYPQETVSGKDSDGIAYKDVSFELIIKPSANCPVEDDIWG